MKINILKDYEEMSLSTSQFIIEVMKKEPEGLYCFAGGDTPVRTLQLLVEAHQKKIIDLTKAYYIELDEWVGLKQDNAGSCLSYLNRNLFIPAAIPQDHIHHFDSLSCDLTHECQKANEYIKKHGTLTLVLLGVGENGHLGFNEPGVDFSYESHVIPLSSTTQNVGQKYFQENMILKEGITLGIKQLMESKVMIVIANGIKKQNAIRQILQGKVTNSCPATIINKHNDAYLFIDELAGGKHEDTY